MKTKGKKIATRIGYSANHIYAPSFSYRDIAPGYSKKDLVRMLNEGQAIAVVVVPEDSYGTTIYDVLIS